MYDESGVIIRLKLQESKVSMTNFLNIWQSMKNDYVTSNGDLDWD